MSRKTETVTRLVDLYRQVTSRPTPTSARFQAVLPGSSIYPITSLWSQRDLERGQMYSFQMNHVFNEPTKHVSSIGVSEASTEAMSSVAKSRLCIVRQIVEGANKKQFLEIWENGWLKKNFDIAALDVHGQIYTDSEFGTLEWSPQEDKVLFVAEKKKPKSEPFYKPKPRDDIKTKNLDNEERVIKGEEYTYVEDWGEQLVGKSQPVVIVCDIEDETFTELTGLPSEYSPGQLIWDENGHGVFGIGVLSSPNRLGLIYCTNRPGIVFHLSNSGTFRILSQAGKSPRSCRLSPNGKDLYWLQRPAGGPHHQAQELVKCELTSGLIKVIVPIAPTNNATCLGVTDPKLPQRCFANNGKTIVFNTTQKTQLCAFAVDLETLQLTAIRDATGSLTVLDVLDDKILLSISSIFETPYLAVSGISCSQNTRIRITKSCKMLKKHNLEVLEFQNGKYNALLVSPSNAEPQSSPLMVFSHGGPHSSIVDSYMIDPAFFASLGFTVLLVNYIGSTGNGQESIDELLGQIGKLDIENVNDAVDFVLKEKNYIDSSKIVAYGGSHGGFISLHLSGQFPDRYKAVVVRNPVVDLPAMYTSSDIPDWVTVECGYNFNSTQDISEDLRKKMAEVSPIRYIDSVKAATLLLVGSADLRVPPSQPLYYYRALKSRGIKTKLHLYNDSHPLNKVPVHLDCLINSGLWILKAFDIMTD